MQYLPKNTKTGYLVSLFSVLIKLLVRVRLAFFRVHVPTRTCRDRSSLFPEFGFKAQLPVLERSLNLLQRKRKISVQRSVYSCDFAQAFE